MQVLGHSGIRVKYPGEEAMPPLGGSAPIYYNRQNPEAADSTWGRARSFFYRPNQAVYKADNRCTLFLAIEMKLCASHV